MWESAHSCNKIQLQQSFEILAELLVLSSYCVNKSMECSFCKCVCMFPCFREIEKSVQSTKWDANHNLTISHLLCHCRNVSLKRLGWLSACIPLSIARYEIKNTLRKKSFSGSFSMPSTYCLVGFLWSSQSFFGSLSMSTTYCLVGFL